MTAILRADCDTSCRDGRSSDSSAFVLENVGELVEPWAGARRLLAALRRHRGDASVRQALAPTRAMLSLVLRGLEPELDEHERALRDESSLAVLGRLPNLLPSARPLLDAWTELFAALLTLSDVLVVPDVLRLDPESICLVRALTRKLGGRAPHFILGCNPSSLASDVFGKAAEASIRRETAWLLALPGTTSECVEVRSTHGVWEPAAPTKLLDALDDGLEARAWLALERGDAGAENLGLAAVRTAFGAFAYASAARLALRCLPYSQCASDSAEAHAVLALSSYYLAYSSFPTRWATSIPGGKCRACCVWLRRSPKAVPSPDPETARRMR